MNIISHLRNLLPLMILLSMSSFGFSQNSDQNQSSFAETDLVITTETMEDSSAEETSLDSGNTAWMITATALVLFMTLPGLALFYGGLVQSKNVLSVLMQCFAIACLASLLWVVCGYSLSLTPGENEWIGGTSAFFLESLSMENLNGDIPESVWVIFQMTFAIITPGLIVGAFVERIKFSAVLLFSGLWLLAVYFPVCYWVWGGGWLAEKGVIDFAGGMWYTQQRVHLHLPWPGCLDEGRAFQKV